MQIQKISDNEAEVMRSTRVSLDWLVTSKKSLLQAKANHKEAIQQIDKEVDELTLQIQELKAAGLRESNVI